MNKESRLILLQELENRQAKLDGRRPVKVCSRVMPSHTLGVHQTSPDGRECIFLNELYFKESKLFRNKDESIFNVAGAVSTVLHEGRHSFQHNSVDKKDTNKVSDRQLLSWAATMAGFGGKYVTPPYCSFALYAMQEIEMDARRFAHNQIVEINRVFQSVGLRDLNFENRISLDHTRECELIEQIRREFSHEKLDAYERSVIEEFKKNNPDVNIKELRPFEHVRYILDHPEIKSTEMLEILDRMAKEKLAIKDSEKLALPHELREGLAANRL